jgi:succinate-semialdehyde dehydrogenase / glutarate-semialdehyde dehydrogenase
MFFQTVNPATGELVQTFKEISDADLELALATAHKAYETDWRLRPVAERAKIVSRAATILREKADEYAGYLTLEMGKRIAESHSEVAVSAAILDYYAKRAESYLEPKLLPESPGAELHTDPIGVLLGIEPWNYPYYQIARVAGPQLMVGNVLAPETRGKRAAGSIGVCPPLRGSRRTGGRLHQRFCHDRTGRTRDRGSESPWRHPDRERAGGRGGR